MVLVLAQSVLVGSVGSAVLVSARSGVGDKDKDTAVVMVPVGSVLVGAYIDGAGYCNRECLYIRGERGFDSARALGVEHP
ncbi:hypothetical protein HMPREF3048_03860 [Corynebacterium sp. HMSC075D04]|nr:hypothetical protein HMPREF3048_03860 [Corynebacterium sp. HMSC075D04]